MEVGLTDISRTQDNDIFSAIHKYLKGIMSQNLHIICIDDFEKTRKIMIPARIELILLRWSYR